MKEFILEEEIEKVNNENTKEYLREVISSYNNGSYRSAIVVLYTTVIYDLLQKLVVLRDIYNEDGAKDILNDIKKQQKANPKSPIWETNLIENVKKRTNLISAVEMEELLYLKAERNYAVHPIVNIDNENINKQLELKMITKETAKDLIRKAFEIVFLKDVIIAKKFIEDFCSNLAHFYDRVETDGLKDFLNNRYFRRMTQESKDQLFSSLWKLVFVINDTECNKNRESNYWGLVFYMMKIETIIRN